MESRALEYAALNLVPSHLDEVRRHKETLVDKTKAAVQERLAKEINYWDHRAVQLKEQELAGKVNAKINSGKARQRADELAARLQKRLVELDQERRVSPLPPVVLGAALIVPLGLLARLRGDTTAPPPDFAADTKRSELLAMCAVMDTERRLGFIPKDVSAEKLGYDVESSIPNTGKLRFIEVKGRVAGARTVTITSGEIRTALNKPDDFILAIVEIDGEVATPRYIRRPFQREPDFGVTSVNYAIGELLQASDRTAVAGGRERRVLGGMGQMGMRRFFGRIELPTGVVDGHSVDYNQTVLSPLQEWQDRANQGFGRRRRNSDERQMAQGDPRSGP